MEFLGFVPRLPNSLGICAARIPVPSELGSQAAQRAGCPGNWKAWRAIYLENQGASCPTPQAIVLLGCLTPKEAQAPCQMDCHRVQEPGSSGIPGPIAGCPVSIKSLMKINIFPQNILILTNWHFPTAKCCIRKFSTSSSVETFSRVSLLNISMSGEWETVFYLHL